MAYRIVSSTRIHPKASAKTASVESSPAPPILNPFRAPMRPYSACTQTYTARYPPGVDEETVTGFLLLMTSHDFLLYTFSARSQRSLLSSSDTRCGPKTSRVANCKSCVTTREANTPQRSLIVSWWMRVFAESIQSAIPPSS